MKAILPILFFMPCISIAQQQFVFQLLDAGTNDPVPYADIRIKNQKTGTYSNEKGFFELSLSQDDTLVISSIGYSTKEVAFKETEKRKTIHLDSKRYELEEVVIRSEQDPDRNKAGYFDPEKKRRGRDFTYIRSLPTHETAVFIKNPYPEDRRIVSEINLNIEKGDYFKAIFKVHLYSVSKGKPKDELLKRETVFHYEHVDKGNTVVIIIEDMDIVFPPEGIFVSVECMGYIHTESGMVLTERKNEDAFPGSHPNNESRMAIGFWKVDDNQCFERWSHLDSEESWFLPDYVKASGYGLRPAFGLTLKDIE